MAYQRGTKEAYQRWADEVDDQSYTFEALLPFFEKSLNFTPPNNQKRGLNATPQYDTSSLGAGGQPLDITFPNYALSFSTWIQKALQAIGIEPIDGFTSGHLFGSSYNIATINQTTGLRESSETAFLTPALGRSNLVVFTHTLAQKILFKGDTAIGVSVAGANATLSARNATLLAKKEVILSAGVFQSPQLLLVSGIGPKATLEQHGIPVIADRPGVGQNMWVRITEALISRLDGDADHVPGSRSLRPHVQYQSDHRLCSRSTSIFGCSTTGIRNGTRRPIRKSRL